MDDPELHFRYRNFRGEVGDRRVSPLGAGRARRATLRFASTDYHPEPQWLLEVLDLDKGAVRGFAFADIMPRPLPELLAGKTRDELATILETVARDGLNGPRDLDAALDALWSTLKSSVEEGSIHDEA